MLRVVLPNSNQATILTAPRAWPYYLSFFNDPVGAVERLRRKYGSMVVLRPGGPFRRRARQGVVVSGAALTRQVLSEVDTFRTGGMTIRGPRGSAINRLRRGVIGNNGEKHREHRRLVSSIGH